MHTYAWYHLLDTRVDTLLTRMLTICQLWRYLLIGWCHSTALEVAFGCDGALLEAQAIRSHSSTIITLQSPSRYNHQRALLLHHTRYTMLVQVDFALSWRHTCVQLFARRDDATPTTTGVTEGATALAATERYAGLYVATATGAARAALPLALPPHKSDQPQRTPRLRALDLQPPLNAHFLECFEVGAIAPRTFQCRIESPIVLRCHLEARDDLPYDDDDDDAHAMIVRDAYRPYGLKTHRAASFACSTHIQTRRRHLSCVMIAFSPPSMHPLRW